MSGDTLEIYLLRHAHAGNPDCRWAFYDGSKNRSGRWCDMASCGNRMKARAFRERAREAATKRR